MQENKNINCKDCRNFNTEDNPYCSDNGNEGYCLLNKKIVEADGSCSEGNE